MAIEPKIIPLSSRAPATRLSRLCRGRAIQTCEVPFSKGSVRDSWRERMIAPLCLAEPVRSAKNLKRRQRPDCPRCGSRLLLAEQSRFDFAGRIEHFWACDDCGTEFETSIEFTRAAVA
jgi:DNA-directed RNA polymerase subunit RPC12/RpoP